MNKITALLLATFICTNTFAQWKNATPIAGQLNDITFTDRYNGYAVGNQSGIGNCSNTSSLTIYKTIDEGKNWILLNMGNSYNLNAVHFIDAEKGWAVGSTSSVYYTADAGATWTLHTYGIATGYNDVWFTSAQNGFVIGGNGFLRKTTNGGTTWQTIASGVTATLNSIYFYNTQLGFICCQNGQVLRTTNGGGSWTAYPTGAAVFNDVYFTSVNVGYGIGYVNGSHSVLKTTNGGQSWTSQPLNTINGLTKITFSSPNNGIITSSDNKIYRTTDAGNTWAVVPVMNYSYHTWYAAHFIDNNVGYACGSNASIIKTIDGGATWFSVLKSGGGIFLNVKAINKYQACSGGYEGQIVKTTNGGVNWKLKAQAFLSAITKIEFVNDTIGFATSDSGRVLKTIDAGETWTLKPTNSQRYLSDISFINKDTGFVAAAGGIILRTRDCGESWDSISTNSTNFFVGVKFLNYDTGFAVSSVNIARTYNAGLTWNFYAPPQSGSLEDIVFANDSLGYCAGGFGKFLITTDAGLNWYPTNNQTSNAEIDDMDLVNDSTIYFARLSSQYATFDSCKNISSQSTACLQNNNSMNSISMINNGDIGYCVGASLLHIKEPLEIETIVGSNAYCAGSKMGVSYIAKGYYGTATFTVQISDATGSFASPTNIGSYTPTASVYKNGYVHATIPAGTSGSGFRVRVVCSNPAIIGFDNGFNITIQAQATPTVSLLSNVNSTTCAGTQFSFATTGFATGLNPTYQWFVNGININNNSIVYNTDTLQNGDAVKVVLTSSLTCVSSPIDTSNIYTASINNIVATVSNDTTVCANSNVQLHATGGTQYSWLPTFGLNNANIANPTFTGTTNTLYHVTISTANGCSATDSVNVNVLPNPTAAVITAMGATTFYTGDSVVLSGNNNGLWNTGSNANSIVVYNSGTYYVTNTNNCGSVNSNTISVQVNCFVNVNDWHTSCEPFLWINGLMYSASNNIAIDTIPRSSINGCDSIIHLQFTKVESTVSTQTITACNNYTWMDGTNYTSSTNIALFITVNEAGCDSVITLNLTINAVDTSVTVDNASFAANANNATYQWLQCSGNYTAIPNETSQYFTPPNANDFYSVAVTQNSCVDTSGCYAMIVTNLISSPSPIEKAAIRCYPNPAKDVLNVEVNPACHCGLDPQSQIKITDILGSEINCLVEKNQFDKNNFHFSISNLQLPSGVYFVKVSCPGDRRGGSERVKFIKE